MDKKIKKYQTLVTGILKEYADSFNQSPKSIEAKLVFDYERNSFQVLNVGWRNGQYYFYVVFHFDIKNGKVWLYENRTDMLIAQMLVEQGIPQSDIVLALQSPETRALSGYAVA
jgi:XisI protein